MVEQATPLAVVAYVATDFGQISDQNDADDATILSILELTQSNVSHLAFAWNDIDKALYVAKGGIVGRIPTQVVFEFDAAVDTDKLIVGTHTLRSTGVPKNFVATNLDYWVDTLFTTGSSQTMAFGLLTTDDNILLNATATGTAGTAGGHKGTCLQQTASTWSVKTAAADEICMIIGTAAIAGGKCIGWVNGFVRA